MKFWCVINFLWLRLDIPLNRIGCTDIRFLIGIPNGIYSVDFGYLKEVNAGSTIISVIFSFTAVVEALVEPPDPPENTYLFVACF